MVTNNRLTIYSSYIAAGLLQRALTQFGIEKERYQILTPPPTSSSTPLALLIQPGGITALQQLGYRADELYGAGQPLHGLHVYDHLGRSKWRIDIATIADTPPALGIESRKLLEILDSTTQFKSFEKTPELEVVIKHACNPITIQLLSGRLRYDVGLIHDMNKGHVGIVNISDALVLTYFIPKDGVSENSEAASAISELQKNSSGIIDVALPALSQQHFHPEQIGVRRSVERGHLLWGSLAVQMHPLTGQAISYWAQQSLWLAERLAMSDDRIGVIQEESHSSNIRMYKRHKHIVNYHLRPSYLSKLIHIPYTVSLRYIPYIRRRAMRMLALT